MKQKNARLNIFYVLVAIGVLFGILTMYQYNRTGAIIIHTSDYAIGEEYRDFTRVYTFPHPASLADMVLRTDASADVDCYGPDGYHFSGKDLPINELTHLTNGCTSTFILIWIGGVG